MEVRVLSSAPYLTRTCDEQSQVLCFCPQEKKGKKRAVLGTRWICIAGQEQGQRVSTALVTNIDFEAWADYLGDAPLAMALLDRVVDGATIVKLKGKSYRVHRGPDKPSTK